MSAERGAARGRLPAPAFSTEFADSMSRTESKSVKPRSTFKSWAMFLLRWTIAVVGIGWVVANTPLYDKVYYVDPLTLRPEKVLLAHEVPDNFTQAQIIDPASRRLITVSRRDLVNSPDTKWVQVWTGHDYVRKRLLALHLSDDLKTVHRFLIEQPNGHGQWVSPADVKAYQLGVPYPLVDQGLIPMIRHADRTFLWCAILVFPLTFLVTGLRWHLLLRALEINLGVARAFIINMVGAFYNTFMPGSTGGDVLKAYYAAKLAPKHRTRAVMSVVVDRAIGLIALVILGGTMAGIMALRPHAPGDPVARKCAQIAIGAVIIIAGIILALTIFYVPVLRRFSGLDFILRKLPMQRQVRHAIETMELYRRQPGLVLGTIVLTFPVHITVVFSAMCAGMAFGLPLTPWYYWVVVPVVVLSGSIPISPQGAGVMEFFAILLTRKQGCTVSQAFALTMSIRLVQIFWNLWGGLFVLRGGYHAPTDAEQHRELDAADEEDRTKPQTFAARAASP
jgi:uncharacterized protein (TIRG00374 family)